MARKARDRFARLKRDLKAQGGQPNAGSVADKFLKFMTGENVYKVLNAQKNGLRERAMVTLLPFNKDTIDVRYAASITRYAYTNQGKAGLSATDAGQDVYDGGNAKHTYSSDYNPAIITWRSLAVDDPLPGGAKKSQITDRDYISKGGRAGTSPFGRKVATDTEEDRKKFCVDQLKSKGNSTLGATYQPEEWNAPFVPTDAKARFGA